MAEFKLGRIKFVYQGAWSQNFAYVVDDVVTVSGKTYICVVSHTSTNTTTGFATDLAFNPTKWSIIAEGQLWRGSWANNTYYNSGDLIQYGGLVYTANTAHTSVATNAPLTVTGASGTGSVATITFASQVVQPFLVGSSITVAGITTTASGYNATATVTACTLTSVSYTNSTTATYTTAGTVVGTLQTGLETDQSKWDIFAQAFSWNNAWAINTRYKVRDLIYYGGQTYVCNAAHVSANTIALGLENNQSKWDSFNAGFLYTGTWNNAGVTRYRLNDIVRYGADLWICTTQHTSTSSFDDTKWSIFVNGFQFENSWTGGTTYQIGDMVTYGGNTYTATQNHSTVQIPSTATAYWQPYTSGFSYQGDYVTTTDYKIGSVVRAGGYTYLSLVDSAQAVVQIVSTTSGTNVVNLASALTITAASVTSTTATLTYASQPSIPFAVGQTIVVAGVTNTAYNGTFKVTGSPTTTQVQYTLAGAPASSSGGTVVSTTSGLIVNIPINVATNVGNLLTTKVYYVRTINATSFTVSLTSGGTDETLATTTAQTVAASTDPSPPFATYWTRLNSGIRWNAQSQSFSALSGTNIVGSGSGATFDVTVSGTVYTATVAGGGTGYGSTNTLKILGSSLGGISPANDLTITVNTVSSGVIQSAGISVSGQSVTWKTGTAYVLGDAVFFGANSYICVLAHIGASGNRPDADITATYWNLLASGSEPAVLTTQGDTFYYGVNGPTRLPIGSDGQVLRVSGTQPAWQYYGIINNLVYVAPSGTDTVGDGQGLTIDKPWQTVRYAAKQVEDGYQNTSAALLLAKNKQFILKEVSNYVAYTYKASVTGTNTGAFTTANTDGLSVGMPIRFSSQTGTLTLATLAFNNTTTYYVQAITAGASFTVSATYGGVALTAAGTGTAVASYYTSILSKIERDAGYVLDGVIFDVSHGGTAKTVTNARAYLNYAGTGYTNTDTQSQIPQFIGAQTYMSTLLGNVLANTVPSSNYQILNSVGTVANQIIDTTLTSETGSTALAQSLITIVTNALAAGVSTNIPPASQPNTTISVKTGTFNEVLPIVIPSNTAIVGDELRSTVIQPQSAIPALVNDKSKSINALNRVKTIVSSVMANTPVTPSATHAYSFATVTATSSGGTSTITFANQATAPFIVGQKITVSGVTPTGFNGSKTVTACTTTSVSFTGGTSGPQTIAGIVTNQDTSLPAGDTGSLAATTRVVTNVNLMQDMLLNGQAQQIAYTFTNPTNYNTSYLGGFGDGKAQVIQNYQFIKDEISAYLNTNYNAVWTALGAGGQANCQRDVGYILDALQYDMTYGCNNQSLIAGSSYYSYYVLTIAAVEKEATVAAYRRLQQVISQVVTKASVVVSAGNSTSQVTSGSAGSATAAAFGAERIGDIVYYLNNANGNSNTWIGTGTIATTVLTLSAKASGTVVPGTAVTGTGVSIGTYILAQATSTTAAIASPTYASGGTAGAQTFVVNSATGIVAGQLVVGTGVPAGSYVISSYTTSTTITLVDYWGNPALLTVQATGTYNFYTPGGTGTYNINVSQTVASATTITGSSTITPVTSGAIGLATSELQASFNLVQDRKTEIQSDTTVWVQKFYQTLAFNTTTCYRDAGYIVDALSYDFALGTNFNSIISAKSYFRAISSAQVVINEQLAAEVGSIKFICYKIRSIAGAGSVVQVQNLVDDINQYVVGGAVPRFFTWPDYTSIGANTAAAAKVIWRNKAFIQAEISSFLSTNYSSVWTSIVQATCTRDVGYIVDAIRYDLTYGGNYASKQAGIAYYSRLNASFQIGAYEKVATLDAYTLLGTLVSAIAQNGAYTPLQGTVSRVTASAYGTGTEGTAAAALVTIVYNYIDTGLTTGAPKITITGIAGTTTFTSGTHGLAVGDEVIPQSTANGLVAGTIYYVASIPLTTTFTLAATWGGPAITTFTNGTGLSIVAEKTNNPAVSWVSTALKDSATTMLGSKATLQTSITSYISTNYPNLVYNSATCQRDVGYVLDAVAYDFMLGTNYKTIKAAMAYYQAQSAVVIASQKAATYSAFGQLQTLLQTTLATNPTALARMNAVMSTFLAIVDNGIGETPEINGTLTYNNSLSTIQGAEVLRANRSFIASELAAYTTASYGGTVTTTTATTDLFTVGVNHNFTVGDPVVFSGTAITSSGITIGTTYYIKTAPSATTFTVSATSGGATVDVTANGSGSTMFVRYSYSLAKCLRDSNLFIEAMVYDLQYPGNYKSLRAAELYVNAVKGSERSDMFRVRNGSGLRNCTLSGLSAGMTNANSYGTKRPLAGAFVALDPGFGPNDSNVWVNTRSHYSQNVTMFGTGCSGAKIDAALHAGGNKSMVKNDFTTIISDGIGVWCTGAGSLTELVSVFNYYGYAGYLAELGGRIRATNGNSSYGTYGVIAEGVDTYETPLYATINNRYFGAQITTVVTDLTNKILRFEYGNAGSNYSNVVPTISGSGYNAVAVGNEFRDAAMFETRTIDNNDGTSTSVGGTSYVTATNSAQNGDKYEITIAATDAVLTGAYNGMRIQITAGSGVGQYANILSYLNGTKVAQVTKDSFVPLTVTSTASVGDLLYVASTATLYANMPIYLGGTTDSLTANTLYYVKTIVDSTTFTVSTTSGGTAVDIVTGTPPDSLSIPLYAAGWDHVVPGTTISNAIDLTSGYIIEPRISYSAPGFTSVARTMPGSPATWSAATYGNGRFVAVAAGSTSTGYSADGLTWATAGANTGTQNWVDIVYAGGEGAVATAIVGGFGGTAAVLTAVLGSGLTANQVIGVTIVNGGAGFTTPPTIVFTSASGVGATATATVLNGAIASITMNINGSGYLTAPTVTAATDRVSSVTMTSWGKNYYGTPTITFSNPGNVTTTAWASTTSVTQGAYIITVDQNIYLVTSAATSTGATKPIHTSGSAANGTATLQYYATAAAGTAVMSNYGVQSVTMTVYGNGYTTIPTVTIRDTTAKFVTIANGAAVSAWQDATTPSAAWTGGASTSSKTDLNSLAYGAGLYIAVGGTSGTASVISSTDPTSGGSWVDRTSNINTANALSTGSWTAITYGAGTFLAINGGGGNKTAWCTGNPQSWTAGGNLPAGGNWTSVAFGNGRFVAIRSGSAVTAISIDFGVTWVSSQANALSAQLPSSETWVNVKYGQGLFVAIASGTAACATSPDGINWTVQAMQSSSNWLALAFGNPNNNPTWIAASNTSGTLGQVIKTGARALGRMKVVSGVVNEVRTIEPGSGYPKGTATATTVTTNLITADQTYNLVDSQPIVFTGTNGGGLIANTRYYVIGSTITSTQFKVSLTAGSATPVTLTTETINMAWQASPIATQTDPNKVKTAAIVQRMGNGVLGNPSFPNRGTNNATATASVVGDGFSDLYQTSSFINVSGLYSLPQAGANVQFSTLTSSYYKLVAVTNVLGVPGNYTAQFQINPALTTATAPIHGTLITTKLKYSQVRLTGHDFLYIGTGGKDKTNYPFVDPTTAIQANQQLSSGGGRVFFTSTDQDGNFNVGNLFGVQQATGTATLNASAFNLAGLQSLTLGAVTLGIGSATITQFSTDPYFTANSDNIVPTQKAIKSYITAQIGGGSSSLNVNTLTAGQVFLANNTISNTTGAQIKVTSKMNFVGGIDGSPVALGFFMQR
jgi:hypothetical protein